MSLLLQRVIAPKRLESPWNNGGLPTQVPFSSMPVYGAIAFPGAAAASTSTTVMSVSNDNHHGDNDNGNALGLDLACVKTDSEVLRPTITQRLEDTPKDEERINDNDNDSSLDVGGLRIPLVPLVTVCVSCGPIRLISQLQLVACVFFDQKWTICSINVCLSLSCFMCLLLIEYFPFVHVARLKKFEVHDMLLYGLSLVMSFWT